jgi:3-oxoacyl-[acyl-carrier-protein] synthase II
VGYGLSGDAYHITAPAEDGDGGYRAMKMAVKRAEVNVSDIGYINAHGTSTPLGDMIEVKAIRRLLGDHAGSVSISSTKSAIGHLLGAAGTVEAIFSIQAMRDGIMPPTLNLHNPSEGCEGLDLIPLKAKEKRFDYALSNSFGFGGTNACLIFKRYNT